MVVLAAVEMEVASEEVHMADQDNNSAGADSGKAGLTHTLLATQDFSRGATGVNLTEARCWIRTAPIKTCTRGGRASGAETWVDLAQCGDLIPTDSRMEDMGGKSYKLFLQICIKIDKYSHKPNTAQV